MQIIRAEHMGMCFGVRDAIALAKQQSQSAPVTILGELVHNQAVLSDLHRHGVQIETDLDKVSTSTVLITAHGASDRTINAVRKRGHAVREATCPLVHHAHRMLRKLVQDGFHPVVVGVREHVEVRGLTEDFDECDIVLSAEDIFKIQRRERFGVVAQTTQPIARVRELVQLLRKTFPASEVRFIDTVCQPTKQRQESAIELARGCDVVIVIGGANSNNTRELVATSMRFCERVYHIQAASQLRPEWFESAETIGLTAGTSTPDSTIEEVERVIEDMCTALSPAK